MSFFKKPLWKPAFNQCQGTGSYQLPLNGKPYSVTSLTLKFFITMLEVLHNFSKMCNNNGVNFRITIFKNKLSLKYNIINNLSKYKIHVSRFANKKTHLLNKSDCLVYTFPSDFESLKKTNGNTWRSLQPAPKQRLSKIAASQS